METSYKKLWKILIDRDMSKSELRDRSHISSVTLAKLGKGESVTTGILVRICHVLDCNIGDIMDIIPEDKKIEKNDGVFSRTDILCPLVYAIFFAQELLIIPDYRKMEVHNEF